MADGASTDEERSDLLGVAGLLSIDGVALQAVVAAAADPSRAENGPSVVGTELQVGDKVVFTGEMSMPREVLVESATRPGLRVMENVGGKASPLLTADPHAKSGKARATRDRGMRIVTEQVFSRLCQRLEDRAATGSVSPLAGNWRVGDHCCRRGSNPGRLERWTLR